MSYFSRFMEWVFERWGITPPTLIATVEHEIFWFEDDEDPDDGDEGRSEMLTYFLLEYPSGRRDYRYDSYGSNQEHAYHELYLAEVTAWVYGGALPKGAKRPKTQAEVIKIVRDNTTSDEN
jgi:hypothetical protein